ncbi:GlxA family transcriptional regulator [Commensalibacter oyaizuii]|uniref:Helix-turn-helix domain-containing protein n=1 Tax=Commensalibacter oyaizuii TaxID=3043873 RepID=A0ABT6Q1B9_9PROT|nr:helix-turn-helix domain-containing protein [Commensalibacter sp. TBRC 16381]MDI2090902.1 helix-turn-helix domain-containing protein [Commensalibacter sp. TBRC 16381]
MVKDRSVIQIWIIAYKTAQKAAIYGLADLFSMAEYACAAKQKIKVEIISDEALYSVGKEIPNVIILPPSLDKIPNRSDNQNLLKFLLHYHEQGCILASICAGTFILAETNLLNNREATTHWAYAEIFKYTFPNVIIKEDKILIDDGDIITAGGMMAWIDLGLRVVERFLDRSIMLRTTQFMLIDPPRKLQSSYINFMPKYNHGDKAILKAQRWLLNTNLRKVTVKDLVNQSGLEERTFLRRFKKSTKLTPKAYLQHFKIERARNILASTNASIDQISWEIGYADTSSFRKNFTKITSLTPREYRRKYGIKT